MNTGDTYDLRRFVDAQEPVFERVCAELRAGQKQSHWMWFIFPQIQGLGRSSVAERFAISSLKPRRMAITKFLDRDYASAHAL